MKKSKVKVICKKYGISYKKLNNLFLGVDVYQNMDELALLHNCFIAGEKVFKIEGYDEYTVIYKHPKKLRKFIKRMSALNKEGRV